MAHMLLRMYVVGVNSKEAALDAAYQTLNYLVDNHEIDYGYTTDSPEAGWHEDYPEGAYPIDSDVAKRIIQDDRNYLWGVFNEYLNRLRALLSMFSNEEIYYQRPGPQTLVAHGLTDDHLQDKLRAFRGILSTLHPCGAWVHAILLVWDDGSYDLIENGYELERAIENATYIALADVHV